MYSGEHACECEAWRENIVVVVVFFVFGGTASSLSASSRLIFSSSSSSLFLFRTSSSWSPTPNNSPVAFSSSSSSSSSSSFFPCTSTSSSTDTFVDSSSSGFKNPASSAPRSPLIFASSFPNAKGLKGDDVNDRPTPASNNTKETKRVIIIINRRCLLPFTFAPIVGIVADVVVEIIVIIVSSSSPFYRIIRVMSTRFVPKLVCCFFYF